MLLLSLRLLIKLFPLLVLAETTGYAAKISDAPVSATLAMQDAIKKQMESVDKQRQSVHQQTSDRAIASRLPAMPFITPIASSPLVSSMGSRLTEMPAIMLAQADCPALEPDQIESLIAAAAKKQSLQSSLLHAVMKQESGFRPCAVSIRGAEGLMQLMPATAQQFHVTDSFDPEQNTEAGAAFLKQLLARYKGDLRLALVAYNAGPLRADQPGESYPLETQNYVASILAALGSNSLDSVPTAEQPPLDPEDLPFDLPTNDNLPSEVPASIPVMLPQPDPARHNANFHLYSGSFVVPGKL